MDTAQCANKSFEVSTNQEQEEYLLQKDPTNTTSDLNHALSDPSFRAALIRARQTDPGQQYSFMKGNNVWLGKNSAHGLELSFHPQGQIALENPTGEFLFSMELLQFGRGEDLHPPGNIEERRNDMGSFRIISLH